MKVLALDANVTYMNPTRNLMPALLAQLGDVRFYGPGYVSSSELKLGLKDFIVRYGPFDYAIATESFSRQFSLDDPVYPSMISHYKKSYYFTFPPEDLAVFWNQTPFFKELDIFKVCILVAFDFQYIQRPRIHHIEQTFNLIAALNSQFWSDITTNLSNTKHEYFNNINNNWFDFVSRNDEKILPFLNFIGNNEFSFVPTDHRTYDISVLGAPYHARRRARKALANTNHSTFYTDQITQSLYSITMRLPPSNSFKSYLFYLLNLRFQQHLSKSKLSFTCGSGLNFPIRKFFEIPAQGALLLSQPCNSFTELGFKHGYNSLIVSPSELPSVVSNVLTGSLDLQSMISNAQNLILRKHTVSARVDQLKRAINLSLNGNYTGSRWRNGELEYL